ncbi:MAG: pimeloyl-CoA dehydrogenase large subunit [Betaproteobacteria bacterium]|nr:MAG: pimeloyl-CoA dehydrogenase large subunit [Betaproteobacteria bacterium]
MDLRYNDEQRAFAQEVREFTRANLDPSVAKKVLDGARLSREDYLGWHRALYKKGWVGAGWPTAFGGTGWNSTQQHIFDEVTADEGAPQLMPFGLRMVAPVIMAFGNKAQQDYYLPKILSGEHWWCQGYSEPGSGSDLASLKTKAERATDADGAHYIVNGQKTWTTLGQHADWIFCLVRTSTDGRQQEGISFLLIDMKSPGVTVRPIIMLDQEHEVNEVWFDNVRVPAENLIGEENKGWTYAKFLLSHERTGIAGVGRCKRIVKRLHHVAKQATAHGQPLIEDVRFRDRLAQVEIELRALEITLLRVLDAEREKRAPGPEASLLKIKGSEIQQTLTELTMMAAGPAALPYVREGEHEAQDVAWLSDEAYRYATGTYFNFRKTTIYGGSNEIQRNIVTQLVLGL